MHTIKQALADAQQHLAKLQDVTTKLEAEILLAFTLEKPRSFLYTWPEHLLNAEQLKLFESIVKRRSEGEPVAYITGVREFWGLLLKVTPATLIPRPETERLVEIALQYIPEDEPRKIADLGTGSGAIALAIASERPHCQILATDINLQTLDVARQNQQTLRLNNIKFFLGDWLNPLAGQKFDLIISNPPYVAANDPHLQQGDLRFEPTQALSSGPDGLQDIRNILSNADNFLHPGGWLLLEHGYDQGEAVTDLLQMRGFVNVSCFRDYGLRERASIGQLSIDRV